MTPEEINEVIILGKLSGKLVKLYFDHESAKWLSPRSTSCLYIPWKERRYVTSTWTYDAKNCAAITFSIDPEGNKKEMEKPATRAVLSDIHISEVSGIS